METRLLIDGAGARRQPDHSLHRLLARAFRYNDMLMRSGGTMRQLAAEAGVGGSCFTRILRLSFLAPEVVKAILRDRHPIVLTAKRIANEIRLPIVWDQHARCSESDDLPHRRRHAARRCPGRAARATSRTHE